MMAQTAVSVQPLMVTTDNARPGEWTSGLCDCCDDMNICCCGFWCGYCLMCKTSQEFGECLCLPLLEICFGCMINPITLAIRTGMRERYHIKGSIEADCCEAACCTMCAWCQMARELKARKRSLVVINTAVTPVYQPPVFLQPTQAVNIAYQPPPPVNPAHY